MVAHICDSIYLGGKDRRITILGPTWAKLVKSPSKNKRTGGIVQVVEHLPIKHIVLDSIPSTAKTNKRKHVWLAFYRLYLLIACFAVQQLS
jgi:hypothetical protein